MKKLSLSVIIITMLFMNINCSDDDLPNEADSAYLNYETKSELELPFNEEWWVFWGGRSVRENYHAALKEQRFALDIVQKVDGSTHTGKGSKNEDYYCFGKPLNAPGNGKIVEVVNDIEDNIPGVFNRDFPTGNRVIIDHENGEFSILAHFKKGSIIVSVGDTVVKGQELGKAGNSGNSSEPHLHYHLQTTADPFNGEGLPAKFLNYYADGVLIEKGEPVRNQKIKNDN
ncbi:peptidase M23-like protein [Aquimarina sp. MAR_2010_214]|uniref:M23 family metallopeptidase n=1 Tax=Aquimarina sp. MAR_2010_214 TaxID=1250026 RepID=UPI000C7083B1|nr:M23 family metallopeptidase [Aquimarina sp. MAR_2010_214]PKV50254.1 peptidase M23-like protein [Aquimarina sp. MAR_2010_214]